MRMPQVTRAPTNDQRDEQAETQRASAFRLLTSLYDRMERMIEASVQASKTLREQLNEQP